MILCSADAEHQVALFEAQSFLRVSLVSSSVLSHANGSSVRGATSPHASCATAASCAAFYRCSRAVALQFGLGPRRQPFRSDSRTSGILPRKPRARPRRPGGCERFQALLDLAHVSKRPRRRAHGGGGWGSRLPRKSECPPSQLSANGSRTNPGSTFEWCVKTHPAAVPICRPYLSPYLSMPARSRRRPWGRRNVITHTATFIVRNRGLVLSGPRRAVFRTPGAGAADRTGARSGRSAMQPHARQATWRREGDSRRPTRVGSI